MSVFRNRGKRNRRGDCPARKNFKHKIYIKLPPAVQSPKKKEVLRLDVRLMTALQVLQVSHCARPSTDSPRKPSRIGGRVLTRAKRKCGEKLSSPKSRHAASEPRPGPPATRPGACGGARTAELSPLSSPHLLLSRKERKKTDNPNEGWEERRTGSPPCAHLHEQDFGRSKDDQGRCQRSTTGA